MSQLDINQALRNIPLLRSFKTPQGRQTAIGSTAVFLCLLIATSRYGREAQVIEYLRGKPGAAPCAVLNLPITL